MSVGDDRDIQDNLGRRERGPRTAAVAALFAVALVATPHVRLRADAATAAAADGAPHLRVTHIDWRSKSGTCTADIRHAAIEGVPASVKARVDAALATAFDAQTTLGKAAAGARDAACLALAKDDADPGASPGSLHIYEGTDWTTGLVHGRWLSVRLHATSGASGQAHPSDAYVSYTFDLTHGGYPVPTSGFYTNSQRAGLNSAIAAAELRALKDEAKKDPGMTVDRDYVKTKDDALTVEASQILVTPSGIELTDLEPSDAGRNFIVSVPFSALTHVGTPGGPLDPATR